MLALVLPLSGCRFSSVSVIARFSLVDVACGLGAGAFSLPVVCKFKPERACARRQMIVDFSVIESRNQDTIHVNIEEPPKNIKRKRIERGNREGE